MAQPKPVRPPMSRACHMARVGRDFQTMSRTVSPQEAMPPAEAGAIVGYEWDEVGIDGGQF